MEQRESDERRMDELLEKVQREGLQALSDEERRFLKEWVRRQHGPVIARLTQDFESKRQAIVQQLLARLNGRLTSQDCAYIEGAFRLLQNQFLHGPIVPAGHGTRAAIRGAGQGQGES